MMLSVSEMRYIGEELDLFSSATHWKTYVSQKIKALLGAEVVEVGAGMGSNVAILCSQNQRRWLCVEPDSRLLSILLNRIKSEPKLLKAEAILGTLENINAQELFDTILYIDVLEHIQDDKLELKRASGFLKPEGVLIVLAPAHQWLYSPFDKAIGHFRRYNRKSLSTIGPSDLKLEQLYYIDSAGLIASIGNLILLRKNIPSLRQIAFWDKWLIPLSIKIDPLLRYNLGKTIIGVWKKHS